MTNQKTYSKYPQDSKVLTINKNWLVEQDNPKEIMEYQLKKIRHQLLKPIIEDYYESGMFPLDAENEANKDYIFCFDSDYEIEPREFRYICYLKSRQQLNQHHNTPLSSIITHLENILPCDKGVITLETTKGEYTFFASSVTSMERWVTDGTPIVHLKIHKNTYTLREDDVIGFDYDDY